MQVKQQVLSIAISSSAAAPAAATAALNKTRSKPTSMHTGACSSRLAFLFFLSTLQLNFSLQVKAFMTPHSIHSIHSIQYNYNYNYYYGYREAGANNPNRLFMINMNSSSSSSDNDNDNKNVGFADDHEPTSELQQQYEYINGSKDEMEVTTFETETKGTTDTTGTTENVRVATIRDYLYQDTKNTILPSSIPTGTGATTTSTLTSTSTSLNMEQFIDQVNLNTNNNSEYEYFEPSPPLTFDKFLTMQVCVILFIK